MKRLFFLLFILGMSVPATLFSMDRPFRDNLEMGTAKPVPKSDCLVMHSATGEAIHSIVITPASTAPIDNDVHMFGEQLRPGTQSVVQRRDGDLRDPGMVRYAEKRKNELDKRASVAANPPASPVDVAAEQSKNGAEAAGSSKGNDSSGANPMFQGVPSVLKVSSDCGADIMLKIEEVIDKRALSSCPQDLKLKLALLEDRDKGYVRADELPKKFLFVGPPGTGKTVLASAIAKKCNMTLKYTGATWIANQYKSSGDQKIIKYFKDMIADSNTYYVFVIDEIQELLKKVKNNNDSDSSMLTTLWTQLDFFKKNKILFIGILNYIDKCPEPLESRFQQNLFKLDLPTPKQRVELFKFYIDLQKELKPELRFKEDVSEIALAELTNGFSPRSIENIITNAIQLARAKNQKSPEITQEDLIKGIINANEFLATINDPKKADLSILL